ncbi:hypothetical protein HPP92_007376 [Vanilla planifolia]|uniref:Uncharacterized protein n=1 Tax=Vanilla planifolia TaxID=51239 RepID=A0A835RI23_VANPL|nr:hypothetical protein HPP92_007376 [Vanilla planifolia]
MKKHFSATVKELAQCEVRTCGMLVQKRNTENAVAMAPLRKLRLCVKHGSKRHEIYINSQGTFGELKKLVAERTGLHPMDLKMVFKGKEQVSAAYLDTSGVKDRSKVEVVEDPVAQAKRVLEMRRGAKMEKDWNFISRISLEVDRLASEVSSMEAVIFREGFVAEHKVLRLIELLMNELLKLDSVIADGDVKLQRRIQVRRVQKYVEALDVLKLKNAIPRVNNGQPLTTADAKEQRKQKPSPSPQTPSVILTTKWETFDTLNSTPAYASTPASTTASSIARILW